MAMTPRLPGVERQGRELERLMPAAQIHNSIQNHDFITAWLKDSHDLWTRQAQIDQQLQT